MIKKDQGQRVSYLLHSQQHHFLFSYFFGEQLKAEEHVRRRHRVQGMGGQEHALEAVLSHLTTQILCN